MTYIVQYGTIRDVSTLNYPKVWGKIKIFYGKDDALILLGSDPLTGDRFQGGSPTRF